LGVAALAGASLVGPMTAGVARAATLPPSLEKFAHCPLNVTGVSLCLFSKTSSTTFEIGSTTVSSKKPATISLGVIFGPTGQIQVVLPDDGTPRKVPVIATHTDAWSVYPKESIGAVFLCRKGDNVTALQSLCPHEGCPIGYNPEDKVFMCPCHKQPRFDLSGKRLDGEKSYSPRDMDALEVEVHDNNGRKEVWVKFQTFSQGMAQKIAQV